VGVAFAVRWAAESTFFNDGFCVRELVFVFFVLCGNSHGRGDGTEKEDNLVELHCCSGELLVDG
jgi:hypothetical protein